ncbi:LOW QUALITY PROTEIN: BBSome-interacting protein 1-like [Thomomys bottae]
MAKVKTMFWEVLPEQGKLPVEDVTTMVLCKPRTPLKTLTLKLEKMQQAAQDTIHKQAMAEKEQRQRTTDQ